MKLFIIYLTAVCGLIHKFNILNRNTKLKSSLNILPSKTIAYYRLDINQKNEIAKSINTRFEFEPIYIDQNLTYYLCLTLVDYKLDNILDSKCQLFVYVKDKETNKYGQYILESTRYNNGLYINLETIMRSFYSNNSNYYAYISYYQNRLDINYYNNINYFDFIYENCTYYKNNNLIKSNMMFYPEYQHVSQLKYKNYMWYTADLIIYYKNDCNYTIIDVI
jgi:hypothetical protein